MKKCTGCGHEFSYFNLIIAIRNIQCPSCGTKYKIEAKNTFVLIAVVILGIVSISYIESLLPSNLSWFSYVIVIGAILLLAPFNQRLDKCG